MQSTPLLKIKDPSEANRIETMFPHQRVELKTKLEKEITDLYHKKNKTKEESNQLMNSLIVVGYIYALEH